MEPMTKEDIRRKILEVLAQEFQIENPDPDENLGEGYDFDSIDALEMLIQLEEFLDSPLSVEEKKALFEFRTINQITNYLADLMEKRAR